MPGRKIRRASTSTFHSRLNVLFCPRIVTRWRPISVAARTERRRLAKWSHPASTERVRGSRVPHDAAKTKPRAQTADLTINSFRCRGSSSGSPIATPDRTSVPSSRCNSALSGIARELKRRSFVHFRNSTSLLIYVA